MFRSSAPFSLLQTPRLQPPFSPFAASILPVCSLLSPLKRYVEELTKKDSEKWQLSEVDKAMVKGAEKACEMIEDKADSHLIRLTSRMEWFPVVYHLMDKVALVVLPVLGYYTGKYHLNDTMAFLWLMAAMPIFIMSVIWGINEVWAWLERRKKKPKLRA